MNQGLFGWPMQVPRVAFICIQDQRTSGVQGGTATSGSWQTRTLNTVTSDSAGISRLDSNQVTLPPGTYRVNAVTTHNVVNYYQSRLQNITDGTTAALGTSGFTNANVSMSEISDRFTITSSKVFELQSRVSLTRATDGYGAGGGFGTEVYAILQLWRES